jgi:class 3 adenylate cyclase
MALADTLETDIKTIFGSTWNVRDGQVVPETEDIALANGAVKLDAVILYTDLANSTKLARAFPRSVAAKIVRAFLSSMTRLVKEHDGAVRSFDGDRVMGVFVGGSKNTNAAKCALKMNYTVLKILKPRAEAKFPSLKQKGFRIAHCVGVARSENIYVVRGGVRGSNDLVFVGSAPNIAAKLSEVRNSPYNTYITWDVYNNLPRDARIGSNGKNMWESVYRPLGDERWHCYRSSWTWKP